MHNSNSKDEIVMPENWQEKRDKIRLKMMDDAEARRVERVQALGKSHFKRTMMRVSWG